MMLRRLTIAALPMGITLQDTKAIEGDKVSDWARRAARHQPGEQHG